MRRVDPGQGDSAGIPWKGRDLKPSPFSGDDGHGDPELLTALERWRAGKVSLANLVAALAGKRVVVPVMAQVENLVMNEATDLVVDKDASTGVVCVSAPDGRTALPVFTSVPALMRWHDKARPIPVESERAALAAVSEEWPLLVLDPGDPNPPIIPRPAVWALAQGQADQWIPAPIDPDLARDVTATLLRIPGIEGARVEAGESAETAIIVQAVPGMERAELQELIRSIQSELASSEAVAQKIDSLELRVV